MNKSDMSSEDEIYIENNYTYYKNLNFLFSGWPPGQPLNYMRMARDLKTQFFQTLTGIIYSYI